MTGQRIETLTGGGYLLLNLLEDFEKQEACALTVNAEEAVKIAWKSAINSFPGQITPIEPSEPYVHASLGARLTNSGYVTVAFNNSENANQVPPALPISIEIIQVDSNLYSGELEVIQPGDVLAEQLSVRHSADLAGHVSECEFRWKWAMPACSS